MTPERWQSIKDKIEGLLAVAAPQRSSYLDQIAGNDLELRRELESLLLAHENIPDDFLNVPLYAEQETAVSDAPMVGKRLGQYQIVAEIGHGGMAEVYRALRVDDQFQKEVAIKLIRAGRESQFVISRFKTERQILASLEHPNISRLLDGGTTAEGVPYFVMELIEGESILQYCSRNALDIAACLKLFLQVCSAVQFAHQRLIIHRDIKPGNILVTADGTPKLLDFGISKIFGSQGETGPAEQTVTLFRMLTPAYASPEQIKGEPITTATDVYSLGVVLYELLAGRHPFRIDAIPGQIVHSVCDQEPEKPSTAVRRRQELANTGPPNSSANILAATTRLSKRLRGDLDTIVLMALRKEPQRRYASVEQFAEDIRRYLGNLPVVARKDTTRYRAEKFVLRHKTGVAATAVVLLTFLAAFGITIREERIAQRRFNDVHALADSLIFDVHDSIRDLPGATPARKMIADRAVQYLNTLARDATGDIGLQRELATAYERLGLVQGHTLQDNLGDTKGSLASYKEALSLRKQIDTKSIDWNDRLALARCYRLVADMQAVLRTDGARGDIDQAIAISERLNRQHPNSFGILHELAIAYTVSSGIGYPEDPNEQAKSEDATNKTLTTYEAALKIEPDDLDTRHEYALRLRSMGNALENTNPKRAFDYFQRVLQIELDLTQRSGAVKYARALAVTYRDLGTVYENLGETGQWIASQKRCLEILQGINRADPENATARRSLAIEYVNMALVLSKTGHVQLAIEDWQKALAIIRSLVAPDPEDKFNRHYFGTIVAAGGTILMRQHKPEAALKQFDEARSIYLSLRDSGGASWFEIASAAQCTVKMAEVELLRGNATVAADEFNQALALAEPLIARKPPNLNALYAAADAYSGLGDLALRNDQAARSSANRRANLELARSWYGKSLATWHHIEHPNRSSPANSLDAGDPAQVAKKLARCDATLSHK